MIKTFYIKFPAYTGVEKRKIYVYLPQDYVYTARRYPVLYMFDGHNVFFDSDATYGKSWGLGRYLKRCRAPLIVVGVDCNHNPDGARILEYSPFDFTMHTSWKDGDEDPDAPLETYPGYGDDTMRWYVEKLKPLIDRKYRTVPGREGTFIMGSSMGGLMSIYAAVEYSEVFSKACALSPSFERWYDSLRECVEEADISPDTELFIDYGSEEEDVDEAVDHMADICGLLISKNVPVTTRIVPGGTHCEASWEKELPFAISTLMYEWE